MLNAYEPIAVMFVEGISTFLSDVHPANKFAGISTRFSGKTKFSSEVHPSNAAAPIEVTSEAISISSRAVQFLKALLSILVTDDGMVMLVS